MSDIEQLLNKSMRKSLWTPFIRAIREYQLIEEGDRIAVAISGGKDSFLLAKLFSLLHRHGHRNFSLQFFVMDPGYEIEHREQIKALGEILKIPLTIHSQPIFDQVMAQSEKPCYLCARKRRGALYAIAQELGCNKLALGHHYDDVIETILMNTLVGGITMTMMPKLHAEHFPGMELIRPLYYVREKDILRFVQHSGLSFLNCACRVAEGKVDGTREKIAKLIRDLKGDFSQVESAIFSSSRHVHTRAILGWDEAGKWHSFLEDYKKPSGQRESLLCIHGEEER